MQKPSMSLEADGSLYFQPTVVGSSTQRRHCIRNLSHLPLRLVSMVSVLCTRPMMILRWLTASSSGSLWLFFYDRFQWKIAEPDQEFIYVQPNHGELHPNDNSVSNKCNSKNPIQRTLDFTAYNLFRSRCGHSAHWKKRNTHLHRNSRFGQHTPLDVTTQNSPLMWQEWAPKGLYW